jgi:predicted RNA-binding Zn-ribbon protein involved in translation (DUF1610 family)
MAITDKVTSAKCPKCGSFEVEIKHRKIDCSKFSIITKKYIKCNICGFEG